jgi:trimeric autotransporter adhesin
MRHAACAGDGGSGAQAPTGTYTIGGTVSGLTGQGLVLRNSNGDQVALSAGSGLFTFPLALSSGASYAVAVAIQPSVPVQSCAVTNGSGVVGTANVANVSVDCATGPFTALANQPPEPGYLTILLTDGSVLMQSNNDASVFYRLSPDSAGSYADGSWRRSGNSAVSTSFDVPPNAETGSSSLAVVANGIASAPVTVSVN